MDPLAQALAAFEYFSRKIPHDEDNAAIHTAINRARRVLHARIVFLDTEKRAKRNLQPRRIDQIPAYRAARQVTLVFRIRRNSKKTELDQ